MWNNKTTSQQPSLGYDSPQVADQDGRKESEKLPLRTRWNCCKNHAKDIGNQIDTSEIVTAILYMQIQSFADTLKKIKGHQMSNIFLAINKPKERCQRR
ncbi:hypothetical protein MP228_009750 [Amoeboaphelidium protococcarum]|nr:hypothetical protein MP228_009750 [Amoeboaphelidium protococcarum]